MRVLIISDIHANLPALETVLADAEKMELLGDVGFSRVWCLGDVVGYGPDPNECVGQLKSFGDDVLCVAGNHDWATLGHLSIDDFNAEARRAVLWTRAQLTPETRSYLESLPAEPLVQEGYTITHASPRHPVWEYILTPHTARENLSYFDTRVCLVGHTHVPAIYTCPEEKTPRESAPACRSLTPSVDRSVRLSDGLRLIVNPGSVGQPRDSDARAAYALLDTEAKVVRYQRVPYSYELTQARMRAANLPDRLIARLAYGW